jgi:hypothetical protein
MFPLKNFSAKKSEKTSYNVLQMSKMTLYYSKCLIDALY